MLGPKQKVARKVQAHFGCDPKLRESRQSKGKVCMSKRGIELARTAIFQSATAPGTGPVHQIRARRFHIK